MINRSMFLTIAVLLTLRAATYGTDGIAVSAQYHYPLAEVTKYYTNTFSRGMIIRTDIKNNAILKSDTLFNGVGEYPAINCQGTKVTFFKWGMRVAKDGSGKYQIVEGTRLLPCSLSVVNIDGTGLTGLVPVDLHDTGTGEISALLDWPYGDYIYYEKSWRTREIWKVNVHNPADNQLVIKYAGNGETSFGRWNLSLDAQWSAAQIFSSSAVEKNIASNFPPPNGNVVNCVSSALLPGCNPAISAGGNYLAYYLTSGHSECFIRHWDKRPGQTGINNLPLVSNKSILYWEQKLNTSIGTSAELIRWSVNSDKWVCRQIAMCGGGTGLALVKGSNQLLVNWVDSVAILASRNQAPADCEMFTFDPAYEPPTSNCAGDFWVAGIPEGTYEATDGTFTPVSIRHPAQSVSRHAPVSLSATRLNQNLVVTVSNNQEFYLRICDAQGRTVIATPQPTSFVSVPFTRFAQGVYLLHATMESRSHTQNFFVRK